MTKNFFRSSLGSPTISRTICIYSGRFQPFGPHHYSAYEHLCNVFGRENVFIATSGNIDSTDKLSYEEKKSVMVKFGVGNIFKVSSPYRPIEITSTLLYDTAVVIAVGEKDSNRKLIGNYYKPYVQGSQLLPYGKEGYVYQIPSVRLVWNGEEVNGTLLRNILPNLNPDEFNSVMGWYDSRIFDMIREKYRSTQHANECSRESYSKHLNHIWECTDLTFDDLEELIRTAILGKLSNVTEKTDGQNLMVTYKSGEPKFARNKSEVKNPLSAQELALKFKSYPGSVQHAFNWAAVLLQQSFKNTPPGELHSIFREGSAFLNMEILDPGNINVIQYDTTGTLVFHSVASFDSTGNVISRETSLAEKAYDILSIPRSLPPRRLVLKSVYNASKRIDAFLAQLRGIRSKLGLIGSNTIGDYYIAQGRKNSDKLPKQELIKIYQYPLEILFSELAVQILSEIDNSLSKSKYTCISNIRKRIAEISKRVHAESNPVTIKKFQTEMAKLNAVGGTDSILSIEGIVFSFKGKLLKMTGSFRFVNQILGIYRYSR